MKLNVLRKLGREAKVAARILESHYWGSKRPLFVSWAITSRCNMHCRYCDTHEYHGKELPLGINLSLVDQIAQAETYWLHFTGGEPLIYPGIEKIFKRAWQQGLRTTLGSNGLLVPAKLDALQYVHSLSLSLDGRREINDELRGQGAYDATLQAAKLCKQNDIPIKFTAVLTKHNLQEIDFVLDIASQFEARVTFQPAHEKKLWSDQSNPTLPDLGLYRDVIDTLIERRKQNQPVGNSIAALEHLRHWPEPTPRTCVGGVIFCRLMPNGDVLPCLRAEKEHTSKLNATQLGFKRAFLGVDSVWCHNCWASALVEASLVLDLNFDSWIKAADGRLVEHFHK